MKTTVAVLILLALFSLNTLAQDYTRWGLPEGATARLGKGRISGNIAYSPDGTRLAVVSNIGIWLYDTATGQEVALLTGYTDWVRSVSFSPDGNTLASGSLDNTVRLWEVNTGMHIRTLTGHTDWVRSVSFSPDGNTLASGSDDNTVRLWEVNTGAHTRTFTGHTDWVYSVAFSPDGSTLASGSDDNTVRLWEVNTGMHIRTLTGHTFVVSTVSFSPDGNTLASGSLDDTVRLWDVNTGMHIRTLTGHMDWVRSVSFSPDGSTLASGSDDATVRLWDVNTGMHIRTLTGHTDWVRSVSFSPDGRTLASGSRDGTVLLWELTPSTLAEEYLWSIPAGISLIHIPLKVTAVDGGAQTFTSIATLYDALGGADTVNLLIAHDQKTGGWLAYFGTADKGTSRDKVLTDEIGIVAIMTQAVTLRLSGNALGTNGNSTITLNRGTNLVGVPLKDSRIARVSDLFALDGIRDNVPVIIVSDNGAFKTVGRAGDPGDIPITGGQSFILIAREAATMAISGEGWTNVSGTDAAPPMASTGVEVGDTTPVLAVRGSIVSPDPSRRWGILPHHLQSGSGFRVTVKNLSTPIKDRESTTGRAVTGMTGDEGVGYQLTVVDIETGQAAMIGDILEISVQSSEPFVGVQPLRYTVTAEDVKRSRIQLPALVAYEIPVETALLRNYPNPFNPETWIPYRLAEDAFVTLTIYDGGGRVVRRLDVGHRIAAVYESRSKAVYWDGRNELGEPVASGVYFYHLSAGDYTATRRMVIAK